MLRLDPGELFQATNVSLWEARFANVKLWEDRGLLNFWLDIDSVTARYLQWTCFEVALPEGTEG